MDERFKAAVEKTLAFEGGLSNDPGDPGGLTRYGISSRSHPDVDVRNLTREGAEAIYFKEYWDRYGYGLILNDALAGKIFDLAVNIGPSRAHKLLQTAVNATGPERIAVDGALGLETLDAVNGHPAPELLVATLKLLAVRYYLNLKQPRFLAGWVRRAIA